METKEQGLVIRAAGLLMVVQVLSRVLGYARDVVMVNIFGADFATDAWNAAFLIPDTLYQVLIGGAIGSALIPVFSSYINNDQVEEGWKANSVFSSWFMLILTILLLLSCIFTEPLLRLITDFGAEEMPLPIALTRITLVQAFFMAISAIATGLLQSYKHFFWPAVGSLLYNIVILFCGVLLVGPIEAIWPGYGIASFSVGVVVGAFFTLVVQLPMLKKVGFRFCFSLDRHNQGMRKMVKLLLPVVIGLSVTKLNIFVTQKLATGLEDGIYTLLLTANRFMQLPLGVFAVSIATAIFPSMSAQAAQGQIEEMKGSISMGVRNILFVLLPSSVGLVLLREPIIRLLYEFSGQFTPADTTAAGDALFYYCLGLVFYGTVTVFIRGFYAMQDTKTPILVSVACIAVNIIFSLLLVGPMGHCGLALAYSLAGLVQCLATLFVLRRKIGPMGLRSILTCVSKTVFACLLMGIVVWGIIAASDTLLGVNSKLSQLLQVVLGVGVGVSVFFVVAWLLEMDELETLAGRLVSKLRQKNGDDLNEEEFTDE
ncbi:MAG: murein biosynthesis integral membrane protein MurJ [Bacillota bacterium]|nr:murein biosynthesis integral membrane protein MurJ [Bacillota bacterium]